MHRRSLIFIAITLVSVLASACSRPASPPAVAETLLVAVLPVEMRVRQRSTTEVPGSSGRLRLTIDDVTRNQVMTTMAAREGGVLLAPCSMSPGDAEPLRVGEASLVLTLKALENSLLGDDFATFVLSLAPATGANADAGEGAKIERLLRMIAALEGASFVRNGIEHSSAEAADHLRSKWREMAQEIGTAAQFIDLIASRSSLSGEPYRICWSDGRTMAMADYLRERLSEIQVGEGKAPSTAVRGE